MSTAGPRPIFPEARADDRSDHAHRQIIGYIGMALPLLLWLTAGFRPTEGLPRWAPLSSISAYHYTEAASTFAGGLVALAVFLLAYRGYDNEHGRGDRIAAVVAGCAALLVAFFPTDAPREVPAPAWWKPHMGWIHYLAAVTLFGSFIFFSLVQFPRSTRPSTVLPPDKRRRNRIYRFCGLAIAACLAWAGIASSRGAPIFWPETLALEFFAVSWLAKGRALGTAMALSGRALYYGLRPHRLVAGAVRALRGRPRGY